MCSWQCSIHSFIYQFPITAAATAATDWVEWDSTIVYSTKKRNELWLLAIVCITFIVIIEVNILMYTNMRDSSSNQLLLNIISTHLFRFQHRNPKIFAAAVIFMLLRSTLHIYLHINYSFPNQFILEQQIFSRKTWIPRCAAYKTHKQF